MRRAALVALVIATMLVSASASASSVPPGWTLYRDKVNGFSVAYPPAWALSRIGDPHFELLFLEVPERVTLACGSSVSAAFVSVNELRTTTSAAVSLPHAKPRPSAFGPFSGSIETQLGSNVDGCLDPDAHIQNMMFTDNGRTFQAHFHFYAHVTATRRSEAYKILDSLRFVRASTLHRPPLTIDTVPHQSNTTTQRGHRLPPEQIHVLVLNGSARAGAAAAMANRVRGLGYVIELPNNAPLQALTTAACRPKFGRERTVLARAIGASVTVVAFPELQAPGIGLADCVVIVGLNQGT